VRLNRNVATVYVLYKGVVVAIQPIKKVGDEVCGAKRLANGGKSIHQIRDNVVVVDDGAVEEIHLAKLSANSNCSRLRLRRKAGVKSSRHLLRGLWRERGLYDREDGLIPDHPCMVRRMVQRRTTTVCLTLQVTILKERRHMCAPHQVIVRRKIHWNGMRQVEGRRRTAEDDRSVLHACNRVAQGQHVLQVPQGHTSQQREQGPSMVRAKRWQQARDRPIRPVRPCTM
jgi:hypothetical protein